MPFIPWRRRILWLVLFTLVVGGSFATNALLQQHAASQAHAASPGDNAMPHVHTVSWTQPQYYASLHPKLTPLQQWKTSALPVGPYKDDPQTGTTSSNAALATQPGGTGDITFTFAAQSGTASSGLQLQVCASTYDESAAVGEVVYLTATGPGSFSIAPNTVTLDNTGCAVTTFIATTAGTYTVTAAINYITPSFNVFGSGDEYGEYTLPAVGSTTLAVTAPSSIPPNRCLGTNCHAPRSGEPVNLASGNYIYAHNDSAIPVMNGVIAMKRSYNSQDTTCGPLGCGWTFPYHQLLSFPDSTSAVVQYGDGHLEYYVQHNGVYTPDPADPGVFSSLTKNTDGSYTITHLDQSTDSYDATGQLTTMTDENGNSLTFSYDGSQQLTQIADATGRGLSFGYDANGHIVSLTDPLKDQITYSYDTNNNLISVTDATGAKTGYSYDSSHQLVGVTDPLGNAAVANVYDTAHRVISQTDAAGNTTTFTYTSTGITTQKDPLGNVTTYAYDAFQHELSQTDALGDVTDYTYDAQGVISSVTDSAGNTTLYTADSKGNLLSVTDAIGIVTANDQGHKKSFTYDAQNHLLTRTDANGNTTKYTYDAHGNVLAITDANGKATTFVYDQYGNLVRTTSPDGNLYTKSFAYNANGDPISGRTAGKATTTTFDADGRPVSVTFPDGNTSTVTYDANGATLSLTDGLGHTGIYTYNADGSCTSFTDPSGNKTVYTLDKLNQLVATTNPDGTSTAYTYDADRNLLQQTDTSGHISKYTYDAINRLVQTTDPLGRTMSYAYDGTSNMISWTDGMNQVTKYSYDANNQLIKVTYADSSAVNFTYDGMGNRLTMSDVLGLSRYTYDKLERLTSVTDQTNHVLKMGYDADSNMTTLTYPDGRSVTNSYDIADRLNSVVDWANRTTKYDYDNNGNLTTMELPNRVKTTYTYDAADHLTGVSNAHLEQVLSAFQYTLDASGRRTKVTSTGARTETGDTTFAYDSMGRLLTANYPDGTSNAYTYDTSGNRTSLANTVGGTTTTTTYSYDAADQLLQTTDGTNQTGFTYDGNGNMLTRKTATSTTAYTYNAQHQLASTTDGTTTVNNTYNGDGLRVRKAVTTGTQHSSVQYVLIPGSNPVIAEEINSAVTTDDVYGYHLISSSDFNTADTPSYYSYDGNNNLRNITTTDGIVLGIYNYDAFGALRSTTGAASQFQMNGEQIDAENGLVYLRSRYYDPTLGRFTMRDSAEGQLEDPQSLNRYAYANNDPVNNADPSGHIPLPIDRVEDAVAYLFNHGGDQADWTVRLSVGKSLGHTEWNVYSNGKFVGSLSGDFLGAALYPEKFNKSAAQLPSVHVTMDQLVQAVGYTYSWQTGWGIWICHDVSALNAIAFGLDPNYVYSHTPTGHGLLYVGAHIIGVPLSIGTNVAVMANSLINNIARLLEAGGERALKEANLLRREHF